MALETYSNPQDELINSTEGIYLVNAGAGTGKTYAIVKRYKKLIEKNIKPEDILLITFTVNAAEQMKEEVIKNLSGKVGISKLLEAPIMTFHSFCTKIIKKYGTDSPFYLGLNEYFPGNFNVLESSFENEVFRKFFLDFSARNSEKYEEILFLFEDDHENILRVIKKLCSAGIFPAVKDWKEEDREKLKGNFKAYSERFDFLNEKAIGKRGEIQSKLFARFSAAIKEKLYIDFSKKDFGEKRINPECRDEIFNDDRQEEYIVFMKDVYISYIEYLLKRNLINYEFMVMFAYLILLNDKNIRRKMQFEYVMIDEFQDTDELQFKIIMLICRNNDSKVNLCAVGDWKQGIYGFRNSRIENITDFRTNLIQYKKELNHDEPRIEYEPDVINTITFELNYRSSENILKFSRQSLLTIGIKDDEIDVDFIDQNFKNILIPKRDPGELTEIKFYKAENRSNEYRLVLEKISELVTEKDKYRICIFDKVTGSTKESRSVKYSDICVLSRKKNFCLELQREALRTGIPVNYRGGLELFASEQGVLVLAWLKLLINENDIYGWLPVLDKEGYNYQEIKYFKELISGSKTNTISLFPDFYEKLPDNLPEFLRHIKRLNNNILFVVEAILGKYKYQDETGNKIISVIKSWMNSDLISVNDLVQIIEKSATTEFDIDFGNTTDAVLTQTIHSSKGLEYPVVIIANMNLNNFPLSAGERSSLRYNSLSGLRANKFFGTNGKYYYKYNNWKADLMNAATKKLDYDEERRLLYVAVTRAKQYLYLTSSNPSPFFTDFAEASGIAPIENFNHKINKQVFENAKENAEIKIDIQLENSIKFISPHSIMDEAETDSLSANREYTVNLNRRSLEFGLKIHKLANRIANGIRIESELPETERIKKFLTDLKADELKAEVDFLYPDNETGSVIRGTIDLLAIYDDRITVIDYKTDPGKNNLEKYKLQLSVYIKAIKSIFKNKEVSGIIYFVCLDETITVDE